MRIRRNIAGAQRIAVARQHAVQGAAEVEQPLPRRPFRHAIHVMQQTLRRPDRQHAGYGDGDCQFEQGKAALTARPAIPVDKSRNPHGIVPLSGR